MPSETAKPERKFRTISIIKKFNSLNRKTGKDRPQIYQSTVVPLLRDHPLVLGNGGLKREVVLNERWS